MTKFLAVERLKLQDLRGGELPDHEENRVNNDLDKLAACLLDNRLVWLMDLSPLMQERLIKKMDFDPLPPLLVDVIPMPTAANGNVPVASADE